MDNYLIYIKKILSFLIVAGTAFLLDRFLPWYIVVPFSLFTLAFIISIITGRKPYFVYGLRESENYLNRKGGLWLLLILILGFFSLIYDIFAMVLNGAYQIFLLFSDLLLLLKTILFWIVYAILWFFGILIMPFVFLFRTAIHYLIKWPWWIYKLCFAMIGPSIKQNYYTLSFRGAFISIFIFCIFLGVAVFVNIPALIFPGMVVSLLPLIWSAGAIAFIRKNKLDEIPGTKMQLSFQAGFDSVKAYMFFLILTFVLISAEVILNLSSFIPGIGLTMLGFTLSINSLLSIFILFLLVVLVFGMMILPPHTVFYRDESFGFTSGIKLIGIIGNKFLRYLAALVPITIFSFLLLIIPFIIVGLSLILTLSLRNSIIDHRLESFATREISGSTDENIEIKKKSKLLNFYRNYPGNILQEFGGIRYLSQRRELLEKRMSAANEESTRVNRNYLKQTDSIKNINERMIPLLEDTVREKESTGMAKSLEQIASSHASWMALNNELFIETASEMAYYKTLLYQLPLLFLLSALWVSLFGALILTVAISYTASIFYELYKFREDGRISYFNQCAQNISSKEKNQPLLGFTIIFILIVIFIILRYTIF
jgi:hypothetical protein